MSDWASVKAFAAFLVCLTSCMCSVIPLVLILGVLGAIPTAKILRIWEPFKDHIRGDK